MPTCPRLMTVRFLTDTYCEANLQPGEFAWESPRVWCNSGPRFVPARVGPGRRRATA